MNSLGLVKTSQALCLSLALLSAAQTLAADTPSLADKGKSALQNGSYRAAATNLEKAHKLLRDEGNIAGELENSILLASAYHSLGQHQRAVQLLESSLALAEKSKNEVFVRQLKAKLGAALTMTRAVERATPLLREALESATAAQDTRLAAEIWNDLGNLLATEQKDTEALAAYQQAATLAQQAGDKSLSAQALCNAALTAAHAQKYEEANQLNARALQEIALLEGAHTKAFLLLSAGKTDLEIRSADPAVTQRLTLRAHRSFQQALELSESTSDQSVQTYALGYLGQMYGSDRQAEAALTMTRRAAFVAQEAQMPEALYRWEGQAARLLKEQGLADEAIAGYRRAIETLQSVRADLSVGHGNALTNRSFREMEGSLYLDLADLILKKSKAMADPAAQQELLLEARDTVEQLKTVELESYFCDDCVNVQRGKSRAVETIDKNTAVVYLISLPDRTELLVGLTSGLKSFSLAVPAAELTSEVRELRRNLETRTSFSYLTQAQKLYDWLIRPIRQHLVENGIDTLVIVPDGAIRTIPLASLHDGENFLIKEFAVAVAPGLTMIDPKPLEVGKARMLLNGLSDAVQGFNPLNFVTGELESIERAYPSETLLNESFTLSTLKQKLSTEQYSIVHIASHGQFDRDVRKTFVLTHDSRLTLNDLEGLIRPSQYRGRPVELLVLSACQTAAGDDRAALGLAGVAVKAGARSAVATLWFVNDESTSALISELYRQLEQSQHVSKAKALQAAQLKLLGDRRYRHPCYWSPYLVIGNWL
jgi:CHAT domain-containing protein